MAANGHGTSRIILVQRPRQARPPVLTTPQDDARRRQPVAAAAERTGWTVRRLMIGASLGGIATLDRRHPLQGELHAADRQPGPDPRTRLRAVRHRPDRLLRLPDRSRCGRRPHVRHPPRLACHVAWPARAGLPRVRALGRRRVWLHVSGPVHAARGGRGRARAQQVTDAPAHPPRRRSHSIACAPSPARAPSPLPRRSERSTLRRSPDVIWSAPSSRAFTYQSTSQERPRCAAGG